LSDFVHYDLSPHYWEIYPINALSFENHWQSPDINKQDIEENHHSSLLNMSLAEDISSVDQATLRSDSQTETRQFPTFCTSTSQSG